MRTAKSVEPLIHVKSALEIITLIKRDIAVSHRQYHAKMELIYQERRAESVSRIVKFAKMVNHANCAKGKLPLMWRSKAVFRRAVRVHITRDICVKNVRRIANLVKMALHVTSASGKLLLIGRLKAVFHRVQKASTSKEISA